jgi:hypothetical protein
MGNKTLLQTITDTLETGGVPVSAVEVYPPNEDGSISVSVLVRAKKDGDIDLTKQDTPQGLADQFIRDFFVYDDGYCETADSVYEAYKNHLKARDPALIMGRSEFLNFAKWHYPEYRLENMGKPGKGMLILHFSNLLLDHKRLAGTPAAPESPCHTCADPDCENCPNKPGSTPIKLYTPEEAVMALLDGKKLKNKQGWEFRWEPSTGEFCGIEKMEGGRTREHRINFFFDLFSEEAHHAKVQD